MHRIREQIGTAGLIVAIVALIAALGGGAYAASNSGGSGKATASAKGKPGPRGKTGKTGPAGPQGPPGAQGPAGAKGDTGAKGTDGQDGSPGGNGKSVEVSEIPTGQEFECSKRGGAKVQAEGEPSSAVEVCNGDKGAPGEPWAPNSELPVGATETGGWSFTGTAADTEGVYAPISFPVQLSEELFSGEVHYVTALEVIEETAPADCPGNVAFPKALEGALCIYEQNSGPILNAEFKEIVKLNNAEANGANVTGAMLLFKVTGVAHGNGTWAVTGFTP